MSDDGSNSGHLKDAFIKHPIIVAALLLLFGCGFLIYSHEDLRALAIESFRTMPSGWLVLTLGLLTTAVVVLFKEVKACHDERIADRESWQKEKDELLADIRVEREAADQARDATEVMYLRLLKPRMNHTPMPGGQRHGDPPPAPSGHSGGLIPP